MQVLHRLFPLLSLALGLTACTQEEVALYDAQQSGVYFNYPSSEKLSTHVNFADHVLGHPASVRLPLSLKIMGRKADAPRRVVLKAEAVEGYELAQVDLPEITFEADSFEKEIYVQLRRPAQRNVDYAVSVSVDAAHPDAQLGAGVKERQVYTIYNKDTYTQPRQWEGMVPMYLGDWSAEKHIFLVNLAKRNDFYALANDYYTIIRWNTQGIKAFREARQLNPDTTFTFGFPFVKEDDVNYAKPAYWTELHDRYLGSYKSKNFAILAQGLSFDSSNEHEVLRADETELKQVNRRAMKIQMTTYNQFYADGWRVGNSYKSQFYIPFFADQDYEVVAPSPWVATDQAGEWCKKYYGDYSEAKYLFMLRTWARHKGTGFVLNQLFPILNEWGTISWDSTLGGEATMKAANKLFQQALAEQPQDFSFPVVP